MWGTRWYGLGLQDATYSPIEPHFFTLVRAWAPGGPIQIFSTQRLHGLARPAQRGQLPCARSAHGEGARLRPSALSTRDREPQECDGWVSRSCLYIQGLLNEDQAAWDLATTPAYNALRATFTRLYHHDACPGQQHGVAAQWPHCAAPWAPCTWRSTESACASCIPIGMHAWSQATCCLRSTGSVPITGARPACGAPTR
jgi:hypothetical protein